MKFAKSLSIVLLSVFMLCSWAYAGEKELTFDWEQAADDLSILDHWELFSSTDGALPFDQWKKEGSVPYDPASTPPYTGDFTIVVPDNAETSMWFKMTAVDTDGIASDPSDEHQGAPLIVDFKPPVAPILAYTYDNQTKTVAMTWVKDPADLDVVNYIVYSAAAAGGPYIEIAQTTELSFNHVVASPGKWIYYVVVAFDDDGNSSANSNEIAVKLAMGVPFNLKVTIKSQ